MTMEPMPETPETSVPAAMQRAERVLITAVAGLALLALFPWTQPLMRPLSAVGMLLAAASLWMSSLRVRPWTRYAVLAGAAAITLLGLSGLTSRLSIHFMLPQTGFGLVLLGLLLPVSRAYRGVQRLAADLLTLAFGIFVLVMLMGGLFAFSSAFGEVSAIRVSPLTLCCFLLLAALMVLHRSGGGVFAVLRGDGIGSRIARVAIPLALALPLLLALVRSYVVSTGLLGAAYASAVALSFICLCVTLLALLMGRRINRLEQELRALMQQRSDERLHESEQRYMDLVEQSISGFVVRHPDGRLLLVNEAYRRMTGYSREELLQLSARDLVVDQGVLERVRRLEPGQSVHIETFLKRKDGSLLEVEYVTQRLRDGNLQSVLLDISHRKQLQKQRDDSERRYAELVDQAQEGISVRRPGGEFVFVNDTFCAMLGYSRGELLKLGIQDIVHPEDAETMQKVQQLGHDGHLRVQKRMLRKDGTAIYVEVSAKRLRGGDIQSTIQDVSERKHAEQRFRTMVEGSPAAMLMVDGRGVLVLANPEAERLFGYTRDEMVGKSIEMLVPARYREGHPHLRTQYQTAPEMRAMGAGRDLFGLRKDGREVPVEIGLNPIATAEGTMVLASVIDITERRAAEQRDRAYTEQLREMSRRLSEAQETERRSIARELHDEVGQALTATRINLKDLQQQAGDGPLASRLADSEAVVADLLGKVRQMSLDLHPSVLDDLGLIPALRWCVRTRTVGSELKVSLDLPEELPRFEGMAEITLFRVFQETLSNVLKHAGASRLQVHLEYAGARLVLTAKDDGRGFDAEAARQRALAGTSLGLLGMQERARLAGGEFILESAPGKGAEVRVSLPAQAR